MTLCRIRAAAGADVVEPGAQLGAGRMLQVIEGGQALLPGTAGGFVVVGAVVGVAEVGQESGQVVRVAGVCEKVDGLLVAGDGLCVVAEVVVGVAEAVPGGGLAPAVADLL
jgi:hypothetical protein